MRSERGACAGVGRQIWLRLVAMRLFSRWKRERVFQEGYERGLSTVLRSDHKNIEWSWILLATNSTRTVERINIRCSGSVRKSATVSHAVGDVCGYILATAVYTVHLGMLTGRRRAVEGAVGTA